MAALDCIKPKLVITWTPKCPTILTPFPGKAYIYLITALKSAEFVQNQDCMDHY